MEQDHSPVLGGCFRALHYRWRYGIGAGFCCWTFVGSILMFWCMFLFVVRCFVIVIFAVFYVLKVICWIGGLD